MLNFIKNLFHKPQTSKKEKLISLGLITVFMLIMGLNKSMTGGNLIFPTLWMGTILLLIMSAYEGWNFYKSEFGRKILMGLFIGNGLLIRTWSELLFTRNNPENGLFACIGLIIMAELMVITGFYVNKKSAYMLLPYLGWTLFLTYWNIKLVTG